MYSFCQLSQNEYIFNQNSFWLNWIYFLHLAHLEQNEENESKCHAPKNLFASSITVKYWKSKILSKIAFLAYDTKYGLKKFKVIFEISFAALNYYEN